MWARELDEAELDLGTVEALDDDVVDGAGMVASRDFTPTAVQAPVYRLRVTGNALGLTRSAWVWARALAVKESAER